MIVYDARRKISIEMPDQTSDEDVATLVRDFEAPPHPDEEKFGSIRPYKPNFYEAHIKPVLRGMGANVDISPVSPNKKIISDRPIDAFMTKAIEGITFGGVKLKEYDQAVEQHPIAAGAGQITGEVGALLTTGGMLQMTKLPRLAVMAGQAGTKVLPAATRFIPRAIMTGSTFGTKTFINKAIEQHQAGQYDLLELGEAVVKDTALGSVLGTIGGIANTRVAITSAGGLGFLSSKMEGADNTEALLSGAIWAVFEAIGSHGREARLRKESLEYLSQSFGAYAKARNPKLSMKQAETLGREFVLREAQKVGGVDRIVKSEKNALEFLEQLNQRVRKSIVPFKPEAKPVVEIPGPGPDPKAPTTGIYNQPIRNKNLRFTVESTGTIGGQSDYEIGAWDGENVKGMIQYSVYQNEVMIRFVQVLPNEQKKGIGQDLVKRLQQEYPDKVIEWGSLTEQGAKLKNSLDKGAFSPAVKKEPQLSEVEKAAREVFFYDEGDTAATAIMKTMREQVLKADDGIQILTESGTQEVIESSIPAFLAEKGVTKEQVAQEVDKILSDKPGDVQLVSGVADRMILDAQKEAQFYAKKEAQGEPATGKERALIREKAIRLMKQEIQETTGIELTEQVEPLPEKAFIEGKEISFDPEEALMEKTTSMANRSGGLASKTGSGAHPVDLFEIEPEVEANPAQFKLFEQVKKMAQKYVPRFGEKWNPRGTLGVYYPGTQNVFFNALNNISTVTHEVVHAVDDRVGMWNRIMKIKDYAVNGNPIYDPATRQMRQELTKIYTEFYPGAKANHKLRTRVVEGQAVFIQRMVEQPTQTKKDYPYLYTQFLTPQGEYFQKEYLSLYNDARKIVREYQKLDPIGKIGARVLEDANATRKESFLSPKEKIIQETLDNVYPLEVLAKKAGIKFTDRDPSLWTRVYNNVAAMVNRNINTSKGYVTLVGDEFKKVHDFNWKTLVEDVQKEGKLEKFNYWLVARRTHFSYEKVNAYNKQIKELEEQIEKVKKEVMASELVKKTADKDKPDLIRKMVNKEAGVYIQSRKETIKLRDDLATILKKDGIDEEVAGGAYNDYKDDFAPHAEKFDALVRSDLELLANEKVGLLTKEQFVEMSKNEGYATFKRDLYNEILGDQAPPMKKGSGGVKASSQKKRTGSERAIVAPVMGSIGNHAEIMRKSLRQIVINKVANMAGKFPDLFQEQAVIRVPDEKTGMMKYPQDKDPEILMAYKDGKRIPYKVNAELKKILVELLDFKNVHIFEKYLVTASRMFTKGTTGVYAPFGISNMVVDQFTAAAQTETNYTPVLDQVKIVRGMLADRSGPDAEYFNEYLYLGGERHTFVNWMDMSPNEFFAAVTKEKKGLEKVADKLGQGIEILALPSQWSEIATRAVEYIKARKAGKSQVVALEMAGRVSAPFHHVGRLGGGSVGRTTIKSIPYFNASLQVLDQFFRNTMADPKKRERALAVVGAITVAMIGGAASILVKGSEQQKQLYDSIQPGELSRYIYFPHPTDKEKLMRFRIPDQMGTMGTLVNMVIAQYWNDAQFKPADFVDAGTAWMPDQLNLTDPVRVMMAWLPQISRPMLELATNTRTYPRVLPLETMADQKLEAGLRKNKSTSKLAVWLGERANISPIKIDHLIRGYLGRATDFVTMREIKNPLEREIYFTAGRKLNYYFELKEQNDQKWNSRELRDFSEEEKQAAISMRAQLKPIENLLDIYRKVEENDPDNEVKLFELRTKILDRIDTLHEEGKP